METINVQVRYFDKEMEELQQIEKGDWVDLRVSQAYKVLAENANAKNIKFQFERGTNDFTNDMLFYNAGDVIVVRFGVAMMLPCGKKANIYPRSSTFVNYGLLLTNSVGCIDNAYQSNSDEWMGVFLAMRSGCVEKYDRLAQFDIVDRQQMIFDNVEYLNGVKRGGYGSTGTK